MRKIFLVFAVFFVSHLVFSKPFSISITSNVFLSKSEVKELVYTESVSEKLSELVWEESPVVKVGLSSSIIFKNINLSSKVDYITIMNKFTNNIYEFIFNIFDYTRNGLFYVPIFICLGHIVKTDTRKNTKLNLLYALLFFILMSVEGSILHYYNLQRHDSMYLFLLPLMYFLFCYLVDHSKTSNKKIRNIATYIYIFHPLFIVGIRFVSGIIGMDKIFVENNLILYLVKVKKNLQKICVKFISMFHLWYDTL